MGGGVSLSPSSWSGILLEAEAGTEAEWLARDEPLGVMVLIESGEREQISEAGSKRKIPPSFYNVSETGQINERQSQPEGERRGQPDPTA